MAEAVPETGTGRLGDAAVEQRLHRFDALVERIELVPGPTAEAALEAVQVLAKVYGEALARVLACAGDDAISRCADDELLRHLMVLHDLHPDTVEQRVKQVLAELRPHIESKGGHVELLGIEDGVARVRLAGGGCTSCSSSVDPAEQAVLESVLALAPELTTVEAVREKEGAGTQALIPVEALLRHPVGVGR